MTAQVRTIVLHESANETAGGNSDDTPEIPSDGPSVMYLDITAVGGTAPVLDIDIEVRDPISGEYIVLVAIPQKNATGFTRFTDALLDELRDAIYRIVWTIGGTASPNFTFSLAWVLKDRG
ncbi:hypothetical protein LCGC14_1935790 [marine sediment metagenome]|uniref:Uncharacterized protein n=1 Tax=marine sediment metagenome TaxID=412755 RepID=A0A0F9I0B6_9ZZZZ